MKVIDLLDLMDEDEIVEVNDENLPIDRMTLFAGSARRLREDAELCKSKVSGIAAVHDLMFILVSRESKNGT